MTAQKILESLASFFAEQDAQIEEADVKWAFERKNAVSKIWADKQLRKTFSSSEAFYQHLFSAAGGKTFYNLFSGRTDDEIEEKMRAAAKDRAAARNEKIAKKLEKAGVTEVSSAEVVYTTDGFRGVFEVNDKIVTIESIYAGGYNIQRAHQRLIVKIK